MHEFIELETVARLRAHLGAGASLQGTVLQGLDLTEADCEALLLTTDADGACFLGCRMTAALDAHVRQTGGLLFPTFEDLPFDPYRARLYTPDELMEGFDPARPESLAETTDGHIYAHFSRHHRPGTPLPVMVGLAYRIHDHAIDDALSELLYPAGAAPRRVVGVMGGHRLARSDAAFLQVARLAWRLARHGYLLASGGGPGAMEAANLGAYLAGYAEDALEASVERLAAAPHYTDDAYFEHAYAVREAFPDGRESLAIPTWFYGHEPTNLFASHVAKYFANSLREDGLLAIATHGVVYAPGSAGTLQEVFMDLAQNHYATLGVVSPMVFLGRRFWTETLPVFPLVEALARGRAYAPMLTLCDAVDDALAFIQSHPPE